MGFRHLQPAWHLLPSRDQEHWYRQAWKKHCCLLKGTAHRANCYGGVSNALESSKTNVHDVWFNGILTRNQTASLLCHPLLRLSARLVVLYNLVTTMQGLLPSDKDVIWLSSIISTSPSASSLRNISWCVVRSFWHRGYSQQFSNTNSCFENFWIWKFLVI